MYIFSYGSNMLSSRITARVESAEYFNVGYVKNYSLKFHKKSRDGSGKANCFFTGKKTDQVQGVIYEVSKEDKGVLDKIEGVGFGYKEIILPIHLNDGRTLKCLLYVADNAYIDDSLKPYKWYWKYVYHGARENFLSVDYFSNSIEVQEHTEDTDTERVEKNKSMPIESTSKNIGGYSSYGWTSLRSDLNESYDYNDRWEKAITIFKSRIDSRYLNSLKNIPINDFSGIGFSIVSIICILIETLSSFKNGMIHVQVRRPEGRKKYEYKDSDEYFKNFLMESDYLCEYFNFSDGKRPEIHVDDFYRNVRSALIHESCTKEGWMINTKFSPKLDPSKVFTIHNQINKQINRTKFLEIVILEFNNYYDDLKKPNNNELRKFFARKMDHLCEIKPDTNFSWWIEE
jgi:gamma-glutamylcyclotransferase